MLREPFDGSSRCLSFELFVSEALLRGVQRFAIAHALTGSVGIGESRS